MSVTDVESGQWAEVLRNSSDVAIVVLTRSNLAKWAWSFYRTGAMKRLRTSSRGPVVLSGDPAGAAQLAHKEAIHRRDGDEGPEHGSSQPVHVDPAALLRMILAKQARAERLLRTARSLARLTQHKRERVVLYEALQHDMAGELRKLYAALHLSFDEAAHTRVPRSTVPPLTKHAPEDLSKVIANWAELKDAFAPYPCLREMLVDTQRRIFDDCGNSGGNSGARGVVMADGGANPAAPCACSWRTPIIDANGTQLDDTTLRRRVGGGVSDGQVVLPHSRPLLQLVGGNEAPTHDAPCVPTQGVAFVVTWFAVECFTAAAVLTALVAIGCRRRRRYR